MNDHWNMHMTSIDDKISNLFLYCTILLLLFNCEYDNNPAHCTDKAIIILVRFSLLQKKPIKYCSVYCLRDALICVDQLYIFNLIDKFKDVVHILR